jgi:hypothetical protein
MGYKILGYAVWQGAKWYIRLRAPHGPPKLALAGIAGAALAGGLLVAQRRAATD